LIINKIRNDSNPKIHSEVESVAGRSISQDYHGRMARKKPFISVINRKQRLEFAKMHLNKPKEFLPKRHL
jgi:hypothetical protein